MREARPVDRATQASDELEELREAIDAVDRSILGALNERARLVTRVGERKRASGGAVYSAARERDLVEALRRANPGPFPSEGLGPVFREIVSATRSLEGRTRVAYLGPEGTFSHLAVRQGLGASAEACAVASISEVFAALERRQAELGVVPVENTTEGVVTETLDALSRSSTPICGEVLVRVSLQLVSRARRLADVRRVASHPQPLAQSRGWLERHLPAVERVETASTAAAAALALREDGVGAIGSALLGETPGLHVLASCIEDRPDNTTRFLVIGSEPPPPSGDDRTLLVYTAGRDQPGALHRLLEAFARYRVNLTSIQSRPMPGKPWEYLFYLELEGHRADETVAKAMAEAESAAQSCRVLGSFPRAARSEAGAR
jgi:chorismate mutase/prephenate dehydratase